MPPAIFDELIFDDLWMFNCRCELCQRAKGNRTWTEYRLAVMKEVGENLVVKNAKSVNPKINLIFKPPNWYEQYQFSGYNLEAQPKIFDMIYAGTETRDAENTVQHLQPYQSYGLMRYFEHIKPGKFGGGWVDPGQRQTLNRFAEQLEDTLFARPKEITIWAWGRAAGILRQADGSAKVTSILAAVAGDAYDKLDSFLGKLGTPYGVASYKPYQFFRRNVSSQLHRDDRHPHGSLPGVPGRPRHDPAHRTCQVRPADRGQDLEAPERRQDRRASPPDCSRRCKAKASRKLVEVEYTGRT